MSLVIYLGVHAFHAAPEEALKLQHAAVVPISQVRDIHPRQTSYSVLKNLTPGSAGRLQQWLSQGDVDHCTLAYPLPMPYVAALMAKGVSPEAAVRQWHGQAEQLMALFKKNRGRISLMAYPQAQQSEVPGGRVVSTPVPLPHIAAIYQLAAQHLIQQSPALGKTQTYLLACTQNAGEAKPAPVPNIAEAIQQHRQLKSESQDAHRRLEQYQNSHRALEGEYQVAEQQLQRLQEELDNRARQLQQHSSQQMQLDEERAQREAEQATKLQAIQEQQQSLNDENLLMLEQLHGVQEELEQHIVKEQARQAELQQAQQHASELEKALHKQQTEHQATRSKYQQAEKQTAQRESEQANKLQLMQEQQQSLNDEYLLMLEQLHGVQEELEQHHLKERTRQAQLQQAEQRGSELENLLQKRVAELQQAEQRVSELEKSLRKRANELQQTKKRASEHEKASQKRQADLQHAEQRGNELEQTLQKRANELQQTKKRAAEHEKSLRKKQAEHQATRLRYQQVEKQAAQREAEQGLKLQEMHDQQQSLNKEKGLMLEQLHRVREELKRFTFDSLTLNRELSRYRHEKQSLAQELASYQAIAEWLRACAAKSVDEATKSNSGAIKRLARHKQLLETSQLFDAQWYQAQYPDVASNSMDAAEHYLKYGAQERRNPSPHFDTRHYITSYPDVVAAGFNPLVHFIEFGEAEKRQPKPAMELS